MEIFSIWNRTTKSILLLEKWGVHKTGAPFILQENQCLESTLVDMFNIQKRLYKNIRDDHFSYRPEVWSSTVSPPSTETIAKVNTSIDFFSCFETGRFEVLRNGRYVPQKSELRQLVAEFREFICDYYELGFLNRITSRADIN